MTISLSDVPNVEGTIVKFKIDADVALGRTDGAEFWTCAILTQTAALDGTLEWAIAGQEETQEYEGVQDLIDAYNDNDGITEFVIIP